MLLQPHEVGEVLLDVILHWVRQEARQVVAAPRVEQHAVAVEHLLASQHPAGTPACSAHIEATRPYGRRVAAAEHTCRSPVLGWWLLVAVGALRGMPDAGDARPRLANYLGSRSSRCDTEHRATAATQNPSTPKP
jgi:hypothetical protein